MSVGGRGGHLFWPIAPAVFIAVQAGAILFMDVPKQRQILNNEAERYHGRPHLHVFFQMSGL